MLGNNHSRPKIMRALCGFVVHPNVASVLLVDCGREQLQAKVATVMNSDALSQTECMVHTSLVIEYSRMFLVNSLTNSIYNRILGNDLRELSSHSTYKLIFAPPFFSSVPSSVSCRSHNYQDLLAFMAEHQYDVQDVEVRSMVLQGDGDDLTRACDVLDRMVEVIS